MAREMQAVPTCGVGAWASLCMVGLQVCGCVGKQGAEVMPESGILSGFFRGVF